MNPTDLSAIKQIPILEVAERIDIQVRGKKAMCFSGHDRQTRSLCFVPNKGIWKCFGCGRGGDAISLVREVLGCDFRTAVEWFEREFCVNVKSPGDRHPFPTTGYGTKTPHIAPRKTSPIRNEECEFTADPEAYEWLMDKCGPVSESSGLEYLVSHGIPQALANRFGVRELRDPARAFREMVKRWGGDRVFRCGVAWGEGGIPDRLIWTSYAILFPFYLSACTEYVQGRLFKGEPKYLNPRGISKPLYNRDRLRALTPGSVVHLCEGVPDAIALEGQGLAAVAVLGASSFRREWVELFMRYDVVLLPDGDTGGETFQRKISRFFMDRGKAVRTVRLPFGKDVAKVIAEMRRKT